MAERYTIEITLDGKDNVSQNLTKVNTELGKLQQQGKEVSGATNQMTEGFGSLNNAIGGFIVSYGLMQLGQKAVEMAELGAEVKAAERVFTQLAGGTDEAARGLLQLRGSTSGVVDDLTLMRGANQLLLTGLAQTTEEAAGLTEVAVKLGGAMGQDAASAIDNLNSALLNNSFPRLDTLGISAARVRERVEELKQSGLDMSAAFSQAVLEQGRAALERLGPAADASATAMNVLKAQAANAQQGLGELLNQAAETGAQLLILAQIAAGGTGGVPALEAEKQAAAEARAEYERLAQLALQFQTQRESMLAMSGVNPLTVTTSDQYLAYAQANPGLTASVGSGDFFQKAFSGEGAEGDRAEAQRVLEDLTKQSFTGYSDNMLLQFATEMDLAFSSIADAEAVVRAETEATTAAQEQQARAMLAMDEAMSADAFLTASLQTEDALTNITRGYEQLQGLMGEGLFTTASGATFFDPDELGAVRGQAEGLVAEYERLKDLQATNPELVTDAQVERAREIAQNATQTANEAERNAQAWANISLSAMAANPENVNKRLNEFNQMVLGNIEDEDLRAQAQGQFNLASGVETVDSRNLQSNADLVAQITEEFGVAAGQRAAQSLVTAMEDGIQAGLTGEALQNYIEGEIGFALSPGGGGEQIQVQSGEGYIALAQRTGYTREELEAANNNQPLMAGQFITVGDGTTLIAVNGSPQDAAALVSTSLSGILSNIANGPSGGASSTASYEPMYYDTSSQSMRAVPPDAAMSGEEFLASQPKELFAEGQAEEVAQISDDLTLMSQTDLSGVVDPLVTDMSSANAQTSTFEAAMQRISSVEYGIRIPLVPFLSFAQIPDLARNANMIEVIRQIVINNGGVVPGTE